MADHWQETTLGEIADLEIGRTPPRKASQYWTESLERPFCSIADMDGRVITPSREGVTELAEDDNKARRISAGSLLMSFKLTIGRVAFAGCDLFPNEAIVAITPNGVSASREFLYLNLGSRDLTEGSGQAVKGKTLNSKSLRAINIHLPPLEEQRRIVDLVGSIDTYIDSLETQIETTRTARSALLSELLSNPGDDWQETTLGGVAVLEYGKALKESDRDGAGFPVFGSAGVVGHHSVPLVTEGPVIIVGRKGTAGSVHWSPEPCSVIDTAYWVRITDASVLAGFAFLAMAWLNLPALSAQTGVPGLNRDRAYSQPFSVPPLDEQRRIVDLVGSVDEQIWSLESQVESVRTFRQSVLSELLSGERLLDESYDVAVGL